MEKKDKLKKPHEGNPFWRELLITGWTKDYHKVKQTLLELEKENQEKGPINDRRNIS